MSEKKFAIYFGENKDILKKSDELFADLSVVQFTDMKETFNFLQKENVEVFVFESYQEDSGVGINPTDLDVLLFYATSESSRNRMIKFHPIDPESDTSGLLAVQLYEELYDKYLFLMEGKKLSLFSDESIEIPQGLDMLAGLVGALDDACEELDENLAGDPNKVSYNSERTEDLSASKTSLEKDDVEIVSGENEDFGEEGTLVKGSKEDIAEDALKIAGSVDEDESSFLVEGSGTEEEGSQLVKGSKEDLSEESTRVAGSAEDLTEESQLIDGEREDLTEESTLISGEKEDLTEDSTLIAGDKEDLSEQNTLISGDKEVLEDETTTISAEDTSNDSNDKTVISSEEESKPEEKTVIKGSNDKIKTEFMSVKKLDSNNQEPHSSKESPQSVNDRNKLGQTPVMVLSKAGQFEKVEELVSKGADLTLNCKQGKGVLHYACQNKDNFNLVKYLVEQHNCKVSKRDSNGKDALFEATLSDSPEIVRFLLDQGARINTKIEGKSYLHIAAEKNKIQSFKVLLTFGANENSTNDNGQTVAQYCKSKKKVAFLKVMEAVKRLKEKRAS